MPDPGASANTWGATLNATTQKIDQQVYDNQTAATASQAPIGSVTMFAGATPPTGWLVCDGRSLATTGTYAALFAVCGYAFGGSGANFNLPSLTGRFPVGASTGDTLGTTGGEVTHTLTAAEMPAHAHPIIDLTHSHGVNQTAHAHGVTDPTHSHGVTDPTHSHGGILQTGSGSWNLTTASLQQVLSGNTAAAATGISLGYSGTGIGIQAANANISLGYSGTGLSTTQNTGGGAAHNNMPPYLCLYFIIRYV
jgi:microcystin-dependent protein